MPLPGEGCVSQLPISALAPERVETRVIREYRNREFELEPGAFAPCPDRVWTRKDMPGLEPPRASGGERFWRQNCDIGALLGIAHGLISDRFDPGFACRVR